MNAAFPPIALRWSGDVNILMVSDVYFPRVNGVSTSIMTLRRELQALGHGVTLVARGL